MSDQNRYNSNTKLQAKYCFVCGSENQRGLRIPFYFDGKQVLTEFIPRPEYCGFDDKVHGGILFSLADEAMMHLIWASGLRAITAEVTIRYHDYASINEKIRLTAGLVETGKKLIKAECRIFDDTGRKIATAKGKFLPFFGDDKELFKKSF